MNEFDFATNESADRNALLLRRSNMAPQEPSMWQNFFSGTGTLAMKGLAEVARAGSMGLSALSAIGDKIRGDDSTERYYASIHDPIFGRAVEYWTPSPGEVGTAGEVVGGLIGGLSPILISPSLAVATAQLSLAESLTRRGVDATKAQVAGAVAATGLGVGIHMPIYGNTLVQRMLLGGAAANVTQGVVTRGINQQVLKGTVAEEDFKAFDPKSLVIDALMGMAFGGLSHIGARAREQLRDDITPTQKDAILTVNQARHMEDTTAPGKPATPVDMSAHVEAMRQAVDDVLSGRAVNVEQAVAQAKFLDDPAKAAIQAEHAAEIESKVRQGLHEAITDEYVTIYHGSPHEFTAFDLTKIGTGEGAQAFGHGIYVAENPDVAGGYASRLGDQRIGGQPYDPNNPVHVASSMVKQYGGVGNAKAEALGMIETGSQSIKDIQTKVLEVLKNPERLQLVEAGNMYRGQIPKSAVDRMLDWDKPLSEQPANVKAAIAASEFDIPAIAKLGGVSDPTGQQLYGAMIQVSKDGKTGTAVDASAKLNEIGIPGIKYLDQGSRGKSEGTRNYVIFDPDIAKLVERNGQSLEDLTKPIPPADPPPVAPAPRPVKGETAKPITDPMILEAMARAKANPDMEIRIQDANGGETSMPIGQYLQQLGKETEMARRETSLYTVAAQCILGAL